MNDANEAKVAALIMMGGGKIQDHFEFPEYDVVTGAKVYDIQPGFNFQGQMYDPEADGVFRVVVKVKTPDYKTESLTITAPKDEPITFDARKKNLDGYNPVTINPAKYNTKPLTVKNGGTYYASNYGCDGFDPVNADVVDKLKKVIEQIPEIIDGTKDPTELIGDDIPDDIADDILHIWATPDRPHPISGGVSVTGSTWPDDPDAPTRSVEHRIATRQYNGGWQHREEVWIDGVEVSHNTWNYFGGSAKNSNISHIDSVEKRYSELYDGYYLYVTYSRTNSDGSVTTLHISTNQASHVKMMPKDGKYKVETTSPTE